MGLECFTRSSFGISVSRDELVISSVVSEAIESTRVNKFRMGAIYRLLDDRLVLEMRTWWSC